LIFDWTFANLHVKLLFGVRFRGLQSEWLGRDSASCPGTTQATTSEPFIPGVAFTKKILELGFGKLDRLAQIADTACVPRQMDQREEGS
jgi:hypothetical protein